MFSDPFGGVDLFIAANPELRRLPRQGTGLAFNAVRSARAEIRNC
jgi:hypothetical protein